MSDGTFSVRRRQGKSGEGTSELFHLPSDTFLGAHLPMIGQGAVQGKSHIRPLGDIDELRVESRRTKRLRDYDRLLKNFKYSAALDSVLRKVCHMPLLLNP